jgi:beta-galactosidase
VDERGSVNWDELWARSADRKGFLTSSRLPNIGSYLIGEGWTFIGDKNNNIERWAQRARPVMRRQRNHPSIVMWSHTANFFAEGQDQNPRVLARIDRPTTMPNDTGGKAHWGGLQGNALLKRYDPTRPVMTHAGSDISDVYTVNNYLNMIPLQEREEWMSDWAKTATCLTWRSSSARRCLPACCAGAWLMAANRWAASRGKPSSPRFTSATKPTRTSR